MKVKKSMQLTNVNNKQRSCLILPATAGFIMLSKFFFMITRSFRNRGPKVQGRYRPGIQKNAKGVITKECKGLGFPSMLTHLEPLFLKFPNHCISEIKTKCRQVAARANTAHTKAF